MTDNSRVLDEIRKRIEDTHIESLEPHQVNMFKDLLWVLQVVEEQERQITAAFAAIDFKLITRFNQLSQTQKLLIFELMREMKGAQHGE